MPGRSAVIPAPYRVMGAGILVLVGLLLAGAADRVADGWRHGAEIAELRRARGELRANLSAQALADAQADAGTVRQAAAEFRTI